jgi:hypothetical protein
MKMREKGERGPYIVIKKEMTILPFLLNVLLSHTKADTDNWTCVFNWHCMLNIPRYIIKPT